MKKIECIVRPEKLKDVTEALREAGASGATASEVKGFGRNATRPDNFLFLPKTKIEMYVAEEHVEDVITAIVDRCKDEQLGSGKIAVLPLDDCVRVRTGERGEQAIL